MKKRIWIAVTVGAVAFLRVAEELVFRTNMDLPSIAFWSVAAYIGGIAVTYAVTDKFRIKRIPAKKRPVLVTLDREEWERGEKEKYSA